MKKKVLLITGTFFIIILGIHMALNITTSKDRLNNLLKEMNNTETLIIGYNDILKNNLETFTNNGVSYYKLAEITDKEKIEEVIKIFNSIKVPDNKISTMPLINEEYLLRFLDKDGNVLVTADFNSLYKDKYSETFKMTDENKNKLISFINNNIQVNLNNVKTKLNEYIGINENTDFNYEIKFIEDIIDNIKDIDYSRVVVTDNNRIYALVNTKNSDSLEKIDKYFKDNYKGYKKKDLNNNFYVFIHSDIEYNLDSLG